MSLPPLNALKVFEAIGRHGSIKHAADELFVTPGAASRQLAHLEETLGVLLFERSHRQLTLTVAGKQYLSTVSESFRNIAEATEHLKLTGGRTSLQIWCPMAFGQRWLAPRMAAFRTRHPDRDLTFMTSIGPLKGNQAPTDVAIRMGRGDWPGYVCHRLFDIELTPVCSPQFLSDGHQLEDPGDLERVTLLQSSTRPDYWPLWLDAAGVPHIDPNRGLSFESVSLAYQMAVSGAGVALGQRALIASDVAAGRLVEPFPLVVDSREAFYLIYPARLESDRLVAEFREWLVEAARAP